MQVFIERFKPVGTQASRQPAVDHIVLGRRKRNTGVVVNHLADFFEILFGEMEFTRAAGQHSYSFYLLAAIRVQG